MSSGTANLTAAATALDVLLGERAGAGGFNDEVVAAVVASMTLAEVQEAFDTLAATVEAEDEFRFEPIRRTLEAGVAAAAAFGALRAQPTAVQAAVQASAVFSARPLVRLAEIIRQAAEHGSDMIEVLPGATIAVRTPRQLGLAGTVLPPGTVTLQILLDGQPYIGQVIVEYGGMAYRHQMTAVPLVLAAVAGPFGLLLEGSVRGSPEIGFVTTGLTNLALLHRGIYAPVHVFPPKLNTDPTPGRSYSGGGARSTAPRGTVGGMVPEFVPAGMGPS